jgi:hypothetical protein
VAHCNALCWKSAERPLIRQLFWKKIPEHKVATNLKISQTGGEQAQAENHLQPAPEIAGCLSHYSALSRAALEHSALVN